MIPVRAEAERNLRNAAALKRYKTAHSKHLVVMLKRRVL